MLTTLMWCKVMQSLNIYILFCTTWSIVFYIASKSHGIYFYMFKLLAGIELDLWRCLLLLEHSI